MRTQQKHTHTHTHHVHISYVNSISRPEDKPYVTFLNAKILGPLVSLARHDDKSVYDGDSTLMQINNVMPRSSAETVASGTPAFVTDKSFYILHKDLITDLSKKGNIFVHV